MLRGVGGTGLALLAAGCGSGGGGSSAEGVSVAPVPTGAPPSIVPTPAPAPAAAPASAYEGSQATPPPRTTRFGGNCYDLFYVPFLQGLAGKPPLPRLQAMKDAGLAFARFSASAFWPKDWTVWEQDPGRYLGVLDAVFAAAEQVGMPLVPSLLWEPAGVSDHLGERYGAWGDPTSRSRAFLDAYIPQIVGRYRNSSALLMWEYANEMNAFIDLPKSEQWFPPVDTANGTFAERTAADRITRADVESAYTAFGQAIRSTGDRHRCGAGSGSPRYNQVNNAQGLWAPDTRDQFRSALETSLVGGADVLSIHLYPWNLQNRFSAEGTSFQDLLQDARSLADQHAVELFVGEFGVARSGDDAADKATMTNLVGALKATQVDYAAVWAFDYWDAADSSNITPTNDRAWILDLLRRANG